MITEHSKFLPLRCSGALGPACGAPFFLAITNRPTVSRVGDFYTYIPPAASLLQCVSPSYLIASSNDHIFKFPLYPCRLSETILSKCLAPLLRCTSFYFYLELQSQKFDSYAYGLKQLYVLLSQRMRNPPITRTYAEILSRSSRKAWKCLTAS